MRYLSYQRKFLFRPIPWFLVMHVERSDEAAATGQKHCYHTCIPAFLHGYIINDRHRLIGAA